MWYKGKNVYTTVVKYIYSNYQPIFIYKSLRSPLEGEARNCIMNLCIPGAWHIEGIKCLLNGSILIVSLSTLKGSVHMCLNPVGGGGGDPEW